MVDRIRPAGRRGSAPGWLWADVVERQFSGGDPPAVVVSRRQRSLGGGPDLWIGIHHAVRKRRRGGVRECFEPDLQRLDGRDHPGHDQPQRQHAARGQRRARGHEPGVRQCLHGDDHDGRERFPRDPAEQLRQCNADRIDRLGLHAGFQWAQQLCARDGRGPEQQPDHRQCVR